MAQKVKLNDGCEKALAACTLADIETKAEGTSPATTIGNNVSTEAMYASLAEKMRKGGAETVADLGSKEVERWEQSLSLHYGSMKEALLRLFRKSPRTDDQA
jgi:hypothetical protein